VQGGAAQSVSGSRAPTPDCLDLAERGLARLMPIIDYQDALRLRDLVNFPQERGWFFHAEEHINRANHISKLVWKRGVISLGQELYWRRQ
jgi:hypothetical protein